MGLCGFYRYHGSNAAFETVVFWSCCHAGINILSKVGSWFVDAVKCDLWASEAPLPAKYVMIAQSAAFTTSKRQQPAD